MLDRLGRIGHLGLVAASTPVGRAIPGLLGAAALPAAAGTVAPTDTANQVAAVVDKATPAEVKAEDVPAVKATDGTLTATGDVAVSIPASASGDVSATKTTADGVVRIQVGPGSSSGVFTHDVTLPTGARLVAERDVPMPKALPKGGPVGDAVLIVDSPGTVLGGFSAPWAKDANGAEVATHYEIRSGSLVQVVDHRTAGVAYPVVADPYLGLDMIKSASWRYHSGYGWTLEVTPTGWARANAGEYLPGKDGWDELYAKYKNRGLNTNLDGMRDQYICHQQVVTLRAPNKPTWNLDEWRPNVSYLQTVNASCNPDGPVWFD